MSLKQIKQLIQTATDPTKTPEQQSIAAIKACTMLHALDILGSKCRFKEGDTHDGFVLMVSKYNSVCANPRCHKCIQAGELIWWRPGNYPVSCETCVPRDRSPKVKEDIDHGAF